MSKLVPRRCLFRDLYEDSYKGLFDFHREFDRMFHRDLINWPFSEAPPAAL